MVGPGPAGLLLGRVVTVSGAGVLPDPVEAEGLGGEHGARPRKGGGRRCRVRGHATLPGGRAGTRADEGRAAAGVGKGRVEPAKARP
ncbi:hypothetical protein ACIBW9_37945 [Streptomyces sp. NPDC049541]|uniref:hypothetical protein n=1 Tax=Streptomyces sp. NPDC049541 TaxID=3365594 RepID=UPI0037AC5F4A